MVKSENGNAKKGSPGQGERARQEFVSEAEEIIENIFQSLFRLEDQAKEGEFDPEVLNEIFRGAHSLKGIAGMFGLEGISRLSHSLEDLLDRLRLGKVALETKVMEILYEGVNNLRSLVEAVGKGEGEDVFSADKMVARISEHLRAEVLSPQDSPIATLDVDPGFFKSLTEYEEHRLSENVRKGIPLFRVHAVFSLLDFDQGLTELNQNLKQVGEIITTLPSSQVGSEDEIIFDLVVGCREGEEALRGAVRGRKGVSIEPIRVRGPEALKSEGEGGEGEEGGPNGQEETPGREAGGGESLKSVSQTVRVSIGKLDRIISIVGELVLSQAEIGRLAGRLRGEKGQEEIARGMARANRALERKLSELQQGIMEARMVPLRQLFERLARVVRQICRENKKEIELEIYGADTELDKLIVEELGDPLMHIIRNSLDHGIETVEERKAAKKLEKGKVVLNAYSLGSHVVVEVEDNGRGIDWRMIRERARQLGLVETGAELSEEESWNLLFLPGFSTREEVTEFSGRGVGLDVVKRNITRISGMIEVRSEPGVGTRFQITLPITLAIIRVLLVEIFGRMYAIPLTSIQENLSVHPSEIRTVEGREVIQLRERTLPLLRLEQVFRLSRESEKSENGKNLYVVVVGLAERKLGIVVEDLVGQQDVVIKTLGKLTEIIPGIAGAADLGSQRTILILDVGRLIEEATRISGPISPG